MWVIPVLQKVRRLSLDGRNMADVGLAIQRAKDKTEALQARAGALDELVASGALDAPGDSSALDRELAALSSANEVETELARLKAAVPPPALDGPPAAG